MDGLGSGLRGNDGRN